MKEIREILKAYKECKAEGRNAALASVVHVEGSSYRRPGARMLVTDDGRLTGAISGGCLEGDALRKALMALQQKQSKLVTYDTSDEEDVSFGVQLGCAGVIRVLFEPIGFSPNNDPLALLAKAVSKRQSSVMVTLFSLDEKSSPQPGTCLLMEEDNTITGEIPIPLIKDSLMQDMLYVMKTGSSAFINYTSSGHPVTAFIEFIGPPLSLIVVGAGNDTIPLVNLADSLGWEATVVDGRSTHAKQERFTSACRILVSKPEKAIEQLIIDKHTVFVLMTHNYNYDLAMLKPLLKKKIKYIGILGPKKKLDRMLDEIKEEGIELSEDDLQSIYGPVGLEIGAETAEEIAVSIVAEIKSVLSGNTGQSLRNSNDPIHSRTETQMKEK